MKLIFIISDRAARPRRRRHQISDHIDRRHVGAGHGDRMQMSRWRRPHCLRRWSRDPGLCRRRGRTVGNTRRVRAAESAGVKVRQLVERHAVPGFRSVQTHLFLAQSKRTLYKICRQHVNKVQQLIDQELASCRLKVACDEMKNIIIFVP